jgi:hypothetical protein
MRGITMVTEADKRKAGREAAEMVRQDILDVCEEEGLTIRSIVKGIVQGMGAEEHKMMLTTQGWEKSPALVSHGKRLEAIKIGKDILGLDAPKNINLNARLGSGLSPETDQMVHDLISEAMFTAKVVGEVAIASLKHFSEEAD